MAELDSALNEWIDTVPNHRTCHFPKHLAYSLNASDQSNGTQRDRTSENSFGSYSPQAFTAITITCKFSCIAHSYHHRGSHHRYRSHPLRFALTQLAHVHTWWIFSAVAHHNTLPRTSRHACIWFT